MFKKISIAIVFLMVQAAPSFSQVDDFIKAAVNNPDRPANEVSRDAQRKPGEVLSFFGFKPGMKVVDLMATEGYYTDILRNVVGPEGHVTTHIIPFLLNVSADHYGPGKAWEKRLESEGWKVNVSHLVSKLDNPQLPKELDAVLMALFYHDSIWLKADRAKMNKEIFDSLKSGGIFAVIDHHALKGAGDKVAQTFHRVELDLVIREVTAAGFKLVDTSDLLSHPEDTRDHSIFRDAQTARDQTDRFILKFVKP